MKTIFLTFAILMCISTFGQTPTSIIRLANTSTVFGQNVPKGTILIDMTSRKRYLVLLPLSGTKKIDDCIRLLLDNEHTLPDGATNLAEIKEIGTNSATHYIGEKITSDAVGTDDDGIVIAVWSDNGVEKALLVALTNPSPATGTFTTADPNVRVWRVPSVWELNACFNSVLIINSILGDVNGFGVGSYWSSTESTALPLPGTGFSKSFTTGATANNSSKTLSFKKHYVRTHY